MSEGGIYSRQKGHRNCVALKYTSNTAVWAGQYQGYALSELVVESIKSTCMELWAHNLFASL